MRKVQIIDSQLKDSKDDSPIRCPYGRMTLGSVSAPNQCATYCAAFEYRDQVGNTHPGIPISSVSAKFFCNAGKFYIGKREYNKNL